MEDVEREVSNLKRNLDEFSFQSFEIIQKTADIYQTVDRSKQILSEINDFQHLADDSIKRSLQISDNIKHLLGIYFE